MKCGKQEKCVCSIRGKCRGDVDPEEPECKAYVPVLENDLHGLIVAAKMAREVIKRHNLYQYTGEDNLTDSEGILGIGDVLDKAIAKAEGGAR